MDFRFSKGSRVRVTNNFFEALDGRTGVVTELLQFYGKNEYSVALDNSTDSEGFDDVDVWIFKEVDLEAEDAS